MSTAIVIIGYYVCYCVLSAWAEESSAYYNVRAVEFELPHDITP